MPSRSPWQIVKLAVQDAIPEMTAMVVSAALLILVFNLHFGLHLGATLVLYPVALVLAVIVVYLFLKTLRLARFYRRLAAAEMAPSALEGPAEGIVQERVFASIANIHNRHLAEIYRLRSLIETRNALFSQLVHGMKSSVAVIALAGEKGDENAVLDDIMAENAKLKNSLEQSLNLLRLDAFANDYVPEKVNLAELVQQTINEHKRDFIYASVFPKMSGEGIAYTDPKWCGLVISQLVSNAIKYSESGGHIVFEITPSDTSQLRITDSGIGIPSEDLPRVFDMFFTGQNGRRRKESTGIGLFMAKHIADRLGIGIDLASEVSKGTMVTLTFPNLTKM